MPSYADRFSLHYGDLGDAESLTTILAPRSDPMRSTIWRPSHMLPFRSRCPPTPVMSRASERSACSRRCGARSRRRGSTRRRRPSSSARSPRFPSARPRRSTRGRHTASPSSISFWATVNFREAYGLHAMQRHSLQPRVAPAGREFRHPQDHPSGGGDRGQKSARSGGLGNLNARRDWGFAGDFVEAMWMMLQTDEPRRTMSSAPGNTTRCGSSATWHFTRSMSTLEWEGEGVDEIGRDRRPARSASRSTRGTSVRPKWTRSSRIRPRVKTELGWEPKVSFAELVRDDGAARSGRGLARA